MAKKLIDILSDAAVVRDETNEKANTAERVGGVLVELANYLSNYAPVSDVTVEADGDSVRLVLHLKNEDGTVSTRSVTLPAASTENAGVLTSELLKALQAADKANEDLAKEGLSKAESVSAMLFAEEAERKEADLGLNGLIEAEVTERLQSVATEEAARKEADAELLKRIIGKSTASSAYTDPFRYLRDYQSEKDASGTITKHAIRVMQDELLETLLHSDYRDSFPYIGHMRAHVEGVPIEMWTYVKSWNTGSTNGVFVQVVRTNFGLKGGVISSALTSEFHEYFRTVTVSMANGNVTDVTATAWQERTADIRDMADEGISKADSALSQIHEERQERAAQDRALAEAVSNERTDRTQRDAELTAALTAETNTRLTADRAEKEARKSADDELLKRIIGKSTASSAYNDPFKYLKDYQSEKDENGTITKHATRVMQDALLDTLRHSDYRESFPYIGHMRAHIEGVPIECWTYVKAWNTGSTNGVFVQVVRTNFGLKGGVISSALTEAFHEYFRTVTVSMADGSVTDVTATAWQESTLRGTDRQNIASIAFLGDFNNIDEAAAQAATVQYAGNADYVLLRFRIGGKGGLILQNVNGNSTEQYLFNDGKRYVRYVDFTSADRTSVKKVQAWKLDGVAYIFYDSAKRIIYQRNQWDEYISGGGPSTLPLASASYAGMLSTTMFNHLSNFNIYEHSVPTTTSVRLVFTNPITGTATNVTLAAATSARAGVMTVALYNELKQATAGVAAEETARISLGNQIAADIQSIRDAVATVQANESNHYTVMQTHLSSIDKRLAAAEARIAQLESQLH